MDTNTLVLVLATIAFLVFLVMIYHFSVVTDDLRRKLDQLQRGYNQDLDEALEEVLAAVLDARLDNARITIDSTATPTSEELWDAYDKVNGVWVESQYTLELHESLRELTPSTGDRKVILKTFGREITSEEAAAWAKDHNYRPLFPCEREAFRAKYKLYGECVIVDLGSYVLKKGIRRIPVLYSRDEDQCLGGWAGPWWDPDHRFLFTAIEAN